MEKSDTSSNQKNRKLKQLQDLLQPFLPQVNSQQSNPIETARLGIGIITYNRIDYLKSCIEYIRKMTTVPYYLVIADDGSSDGSIQWCHAQKLPVITGDNRGVVWNKNRALYTLMNYTDAEFLLLIEEDCWPASDGWNHQWCDAISRWHHVNFAHSRILRSRPQAIKGGKGTPEDPFQLSLLTGQCTGCSRHAMTVVGYLDTRFQGYGFGHCEWTQRFLRAHLGGVHVSEDDRQSFIYLSITGGLAEHDAPTHRNPQQLKYNSKVLRSILTEPIYRDPWQNDLEKSILISEVSDSLNPVNLVASNNQSYLRQPFNSQAMLSQKKAFVREIIKLITHQTSPLMGCALDEPQQMSSVDTRSIEVTGWVIGRESKALEVEMIWNGQVMQRTPVNQLRPGLVKRYPQKSEAKESGFTAFIRADETLIHSEILIQVVLHNQSRIPMYVIRLNSVETRTQESLLTRLPQQKTPENQVKLSDIRQLLLNEYRQMEALMNLHSLIQLSHPLPPLRQWAASPDLASLIYSLILERKPQNIVEFGSGSSSLIIGYALQKLGKGQVISLEHQEKYARLSANLVTSHQLEDYCKIYHAPLITTQVEGTNYQFYSLEKIQGLVKADMLVIDGPPASTNPMARFPAVPVLYEKLSDGAVIVLDDGDRQDEKLAVKKWLAAFDSLRNLSKPVTEKGVSVLIKNPG